MRIRLTTHLPISGERIGLTVWIGSIARGWKGYPVFKRGHVWRVSGVSPADLA